MDQPKTTGSVGSDWPAIDDYGIIGDCRSAALISRDGSIDWLCWPRFDSPSIFAALLDCNVGGYFPIQLATPAKTSRRYLPNSNVLETYFSSPVGRATLTDVMPGASTLHRSEFLPDHEIIRRVLCTDGELEVEIEFFPRADYGKTKVQI